MKWYLHNHHQLHLSDLRVKRGDSIEEFLPWVSQIANTFTRDAVACGALNYQDFLQAGYVGLVEAWNQLDHERGQAEKWSFIKKRIKWAIRREVDNHGAFIKIPRREIDKANAKLSNVDKIFVNIFPKFFDNELLYSPDLRPWKIVQLQIAMEDYLYENYKTNHVRILLDSYGIDRDKPLKNKELASKHKTTTNYINQIKIRLIKQLKKDEQFKIIIEKFIEI